MTILHLTFELLFRYLMLYFIESIVFKIAQFMMSLCWPFLLRKVKLVSGGKSTVIVV